MKYIVSMAIDGRVDVEVDARSVKEAFRNASLVDADMSKMDIVGSHSVNCSDENGNLLQSAEDYKAVADNLSPTVLNELVDQIYKTADISGDAAKN